MKENQMKENQMKEYQMKENQMIERVRRYITDNNLLDYGDVVVCGLSGGADSVCLFEVMCELKDEFGLDIAAVHVNHMLRGEAADSDEAYVRELCEKKKVELFVFKKDIQRLAEEIKTSTEEAGRHFRYECFEEVLLKKGRGKIAVAHHENDLVETVLFNLARGSSLNGLAGIKARRGNIIRPLLGVSRADIEQFLNEKDISYRVDATNLENDYARNRIRNIIIPELLKINEGAASHIARFAEECKEAYESNRRRAEQFYRTFAVPVKAPETSSETEAVAVKLSIEELTKLTESERCEVYLMAMERLCNRRKDITKRHLKSIDELTVSENGKRVSLPYSMGARRNDKYLELEANYPAIDEASEREKLALAEKAVTLISKELSLSKEDADYEKVDYVTFSDIKLRVTLKKVSDSLDLSKKECTKILDYDKINESLVIRTPKKEDFIVINKDGGKKPLKRLMTDNKIDLRKRDSWPVICDGDEVVWAIGLRYSENYKVSEKTKRIVIIDII